jgi:predicted dehydrogenase
MLAELTASFLLSAADTSIEIYGTRATALLSGVDLASRDITDRGFPPRLSRGGRRQALGDRRRDPPLQARPVPPSERDRLRALVCGPGAAPPAGLGAGRAALLMIEAAYRAARTGARQRIEPGPSVSGN